MPNEGASVDPRSTLRFEKVWRASMTCSRHKTFWSNHQFVRFHVSNSLVESENETSERNFALSRLWKSFTENSKVCGVVQNRNYNNQWTRLDVPIIYDDSELETCDVHFAKCRLYAVIDSRYHDMRSTAKRQSTHTWLESILTCGGPTNQSRSNNPAHHRRAEIDTKCRLAAKF